MKFYPLTRNPEAHIYADWYNYQEIIMGLSGNHKGKEGCGPYSQSHPSVTHMIPGKGNKMQNAEAGAGKGTVAIDTATPAGLSTALPRGKGKGRGF